MSIETDAPGGPSFRPEGGRWAAMRRGRRVVLGLTVLSLGSGCATVTTAPSQPDHLRSGLTYYLPKRDAKLTIDRKLLKKDEAAKKVAAAKAKLATAQAAAQSAKATVEAQEKILLVIDRTSPAGIEAEKLRATAAAQKTIADAEAALAAAEVEAGEAELARSATAPAGACLFSYTTKLELLAPTADTTQRFVADFSHSMFRDDETKLTVTPEGLLSTANAIATDRTGDILVEIAGAIAGFGTPTMPITETISSEPVDCTALPTKFVATFDPVTYSTVNQELKNSGYPIRVEVKVAGNEPAARGPVLDPTRVGPRYPQTLAEAARHRGRFGALFYATPNPATLILRQCKPADMGAGTCTASNGDLLEASNVMLPQIGPVSYIPMQSSAFVKTVSDVTFDNGMLTAWNANRPSELLEVVRLPVKVLTSVISVPAQIFSLRINKSDQAKALAASQEALLKAQTERDLARLCVETARQEDRSAADCFK